MKKFIISVMVIVGLLLSYVLFLSGFIRYSDDKDITPISPVPYQQTEVYKLYFIYNDRLIEEERVLDSSADNIENILLEELKKGPKVSFYESALNDDIRVIDLSSKDRILHINLSKNFLETDERKMYLKVISIVSTFNQLTFIDKVDFEVGGEKILSEDIEVMSKNKTKDPSVFKSIINEEDKLANKFLEYFNLNRFDIIYELLADESKEYTNYDIFLEEMFEIKKNIKDKEFVNHISIREENRYYVRFIYTKGYYFDIYIYKIDNELKLSFKRIK